MIQTKFKTLMNCGMYVDANLLENGIYICSKPYLYNIDETIESLVERVEQMKDMAGISFISDKYIENLKQCQLVELSISHKGKPTKEEIIKKLYQLAQIGQTHDGVMMTRTFEKEAEMILELFG